MMIFHNILQGMSLLYIAKKSWHLIDNMLQGMSLLFLMFFECIAVSWGFGARLVSCDFDYYYFDLNDFDDYYFHDHNFDVDYFDGHNFDQEVPPGDARHDRLLPELLLCCLLVRHHPHHLCWRLLLQGLFIVNFPNSHCFSPTNQCNHHQKLKSSFQLFTWKNIIYQGYHYPW